MVGYLHYIRDKRNKAVHPGTVFSQEDSEEILNQELVNDAMFYIEKIRKLIVIKNNDISGFFPDKDSLGSKLVIVPSSVNVDE